MPMAFADKINDIHIRPIDVRKDVLPIANLIELCFSLTLDSEGHEYLRQIRQVAHNPFAIHWVSGCNERVSYPMHGYVWEENGRIIGNLSMIPHIVHGRWIYLIANVAVHPEYRRRGIARLLTLKALEHIRDHRVSSAWLQVRADNPGAHKLYVDLDFRERARRTTWQSQIPPEPSQKHSNQLAINSRSLRDWELQYTWLKAIYPPEVAWHIPFRPESLSPDLWQSIVRFFNGEEIHHWAARHKGELIGLVSWQPRLQPTDTLWVATIPQWEEKALHALLPKVRKDRQYNRPMTVNYPSGRAEEAFLNAGFAPLHTLVWMEISFEPQNPIFK